MKRGNPKRTRRRARPETAEIANEIMTLYGVAEYLTCHPSTVSRLLYGKLPGFRLGSGARSDWRIFRSDLERWIQQHQVQAGRR